MTSQKIRQYLTSTCKTPVPKLLILIVNKNLKHMAVIQPRPTHILYQCAKFGDDRASFNVMFDVCDVQHAKGLYRYFGILFLSY